MGKAGQEKGRKQGKVHIPIIYLSIAWAFEFISSFNPTHILGGCYYLH